jgi:hypothetical protein
MKRKDSLNLKRKKRDKKLIPIYISGSLSTFMLWLSLDTLSSDQPCNIGSSRLRGLLALVCNIGGKDGVTFGLIGLTLLMSIFTISLIYEYNKSKN